MLGVFFLPTIFSEAIMGNDQNGWLQWLAWYLWIMQVFCDNFGTVPQGSPDKKGMILYHSTGSVQYVQLPKQGSDALSTISLPALYLSCRNNM